MSRKAGSEMTLDLTALVASDAVEPVRHDLMVDRGRRDAVALALDSRGFISDSDAACEALFKYCRGEMLGRHISELLPQLQAMDMVLDGQPNAHLRLLSRIGHQFQAVARDGEQFYSELFLNVLDASGGGRLSLLVRPVERKADSAMHLAWAH